MSQGKAKEYFDIIGKKYEQNFAHNEGQINFIRESLKRLELGPSTTVLDIGQGTGRPTSEMVADAGCTLYGIDISPVMVELASKQVPKGKFETASMLEYNPPAPLDAAFAIFSLFQLTSAEQAELAVRWGSWTKPGGYLFIGSIAAEDFEPGVFKPDSEGTVGHVVRKFMGSPCKMLIYTKEGWRELLEKNGFEIVHTETTPFQPDDCDFEPHYYIACRKKTS